MQRFVNVRSTATNVDALETDDYHVIVNNEITEIHEEAKEDDPTTGFDGFQIGEQLVYEKDEYIKLISEKNQELETETTSLQMALVDVYELSV